MKLLKNFKRTLSPIPGHREYAGASMNSLAFKYDELVKSRHSREGGNPDARNFLKRMGSRLRTSGMTAMKRTFYAVVKYDSVKEDD